MSGLIGRALPQNTIDRKDERLVSGFRSKTDTRKLARDRYGIGYEGFLNEFWPGNRGFIGDMAVDVGLMQAVWGGRLKRFASGEASRVGFVGITRNQYGAPLGGVTCSLFLTATKAWIMDIISDAAGNFLLQSFYTPDTHFIVFFKAGSPNVFGSTDQNLTGS